MLSMMSLIASLRRTIRLRRPTSWVRLGVPILALLGSLSLTAASRAAALPPRMVASVTPAVAGVGARAGSWQQTFWVQSSERLQVRPELETTIHGHLHIVQVSHVQLPPAQWIGPQKTAFVVRGRATGLHPRAWTVAWVPTQRASGFRVNATALLLIGRRPGVPRLVVQIQGPHWIHGTTAVFQVHVRNTGTVWANPHTTLITGHLVQHWQWSTILPHGTLHETVKVPMAPWWCRTVTFHVTHTVAQTRHVWVLPLTPLAILLGGFSVTTGLWALDRRQRIKNEVPVPRSLASEP